MDTFLNHAAAAGLPQEERDRIIRERNRTGDELMTADDYAAIAAPPEEAPAAAAAERDGAEDLRAELDEAKREIEALRLEAKKPKPRSRGAKAAGE